MGYASEGCEIPNFRKFLLGGNTQNQRLAVEKLKLCFSEANAPNADLFALFDASQANATARNVILKNGNVDNYFFNTESD